MPRSSPHDRRIRLRRFLRRRILPVWHSARWPLLIAMAAVALVLGHLGFREHFRLVGEPASLSRTIYLSLQLFALESGSLAPPTPWALDVARFLAPATAFYSVAVALGVIFREQVGLLRLRFYRDHVVVCGLGRKGALSAVAFREAGYQVAAIERDPGNERIAEARSAGAVVLVGVATDEALLRKVRLRRAAYLLAVCGDDGTNAEISMAARALVAGRRGTLLAFVHVVDLALCDLLRVRELAGQEERSLRTEFFNVYESGARVLLRRFPPFSPEAPARAEGPHVVVVGFGQMGRSVALGAARLWKDRSRDTSRRLRVTVVDRGADARVDLLCAQFPQLRAVCDPRPLTMDVRSAAFEEAAFLVGEGGEVDVDAAYVCLDDPALGLDAGLALLRRLGRQDVPVVVRVVESAGLDRLLEGGAPSGYRTLRSFPLLEETCAPEVLLGGTYETLARAIHDDYVAHQRARGRTPRENPSMVPWESLPEALRESNRAQAADIGAKLAVVGCGLAPLTDWEAEPMRFTPEEVEILAHREHDRWMGHHLAAGWAFAPGPRDPKRKTHPDLVPFDQLTQEKREYDRNTVRAIPDFLARAGFHAYRLG